MKPSGFEESLTAWSRIWTEIQSSPNWLMSGFLFCESKDPFQTEWFSRKEFSYCWNGWVSLSGGLEMRGDWSMLTNPSFPSGQSLRLFGSNHPEGPTVKNTRSEHLLWRGIPVIDEGAQGERKSSSGEQTDQLHFQCRRMDVSGEECHWKGLKKAQRWARSSHLFHVELSNQFRKVIMADPSNGRARTIIILPILPRSDLMK